jgi:hypothetical protein
MMKLKGLGGNMKILGVISGALVLMGSGCLQQEVPRGAAERPAGVQFGESAPSDEDAAEMALDQASSETGLSHSVSAELPAGSGEIPVSAEEIPSNLYLTVGEMKAYGGNAATVKYGPAPQSLPATLRYPVAAFPVRYASVLKTKRNESLVIGGVSSAGGLIRDIQVVRVSPEGNSVVVSRVANVLPTFGSVTTYPFFSLRLQAAVLPYFTTPVPIAALAVAAPPPAPLFSASLVDDLRKGPGFVIALLIVIPAPASAVGLAAPPPPTKILEFLHPSTFVRLIRVENQVAVNHLMTQLAAIAQAQQAAATR